MLPVLPEGVFKASLGALGIAGLPLKHPVQTPQCRALRGVDEHPAEDCQAREANRTERLTVAISLRAPQGLAGGRHL